MSMEVNPDVCGRLWSGAFGSGLRQKIERYVYRAGFSLHAATEAASFEDSQHRCVGRQHLGDEFVKAGFARNDDDVTQEGRADSKPLILIDDRECNLGLLRVLDNVAAATGNNLLSVSFQNCDQRHVRHEVDVYEKSGFIFGEMALYRKEPL